MRKQIFIAWARFQRRQVSMESYFAFKSIFVHRDFGQKWLKPFEYLAKGWNTLKVFLREKPDTVWVALPPVPALSFVLLYRLFFKRKLRVIADCHNAMFRPPWSKVPLAVWHLDQCDLVIVHNDTLIENSRSLGVRAPVRVLEDAPATIKRHDLVSVEGKRKILFPASFAKDEPIQELLEAARLSPDIEFFITGNPARARGLHDLGNMPANVHLTGFLSLDEFEKLFADADVILGLTNMEGVQLSVCNEAVGAGKPMVLSGTALLKRLFHKGAIYVDSADPKSIAQGCRLAILEKRRLEQEIEALREERLRYWTSEQAMPIRELLETTTPAQPSPAARAA